MIPGSDICFRVRCRPWTHSSAFHRHRVCVESDGSVLVWDPIGHTYTRAHALTPAAVRRIVRISRGVEPAVCGACGEGYDGREGQYDAIAGMLCPECARDYR